MAKVSDRSMTDLMDAAINTFWEHTYRPIRAREEERVRRGLDLLRRLEARLGPKFWREDGVMEVGFEMTPEGRIILRAGQAHYFEEDGGRLVKAHHKGGRASFAPIDDDGLGDWMVTPMAEPSLN